MRLDGPLRKVAYTTYVTLTQRADGNLFQQAPTLASGDVKVIKDGGLEANIATLPTVSPAGQYTVKVDLSATEMDAEVVVVRFSDAAGAEWADLAITIETSPIPASTVDDATVTPTRTTFGSDLTGFADDELIDAYVLFLSGANKGTSQPVTDYANTNGQFTFATDAWETAPSDGDVFTIIGSKK